MDLRRIASGVGDWLSINLDLFAILLLVAGFLIRLRLSSLNFLEIDEAYHCLVGSSAFPELWTTIHGPTHPPLLALLLHFVCMVSDSEIAVRMIPNIAGSVFPWFIYRWMGLVWNRRAGFFALTILVFSPMLLYLSSAVRQYTLGLLFASAALYFLERGLREGSTRWMWWFTGSLWLAVWSSYVSAFICGALGVYVLIRFHEPAFTRRMKGVWLISQLGALALYAYLLVVQVLHLRAVHQGLVADQTSYFAGMFPTAGDSLPVFFLRGSFGQFLLALNDKTVAIVGVVMFLAGLGLVLASYRRQGWVRAVALFVLLSLPFVLACAGAYSKTYPFGRTRQTIHIAVFIAIGVGIALDQLTFRRVSVTLALAAVLMPAWYSAADYNPLTMKPYGDRKVFHAMLEYIQQKIPKGSHLWCEHSFSTVLDMYYLRHGGSPGLEAQYPGTVGGYYTHAQVISWQRLEDVWDKLREWRAQDNVRDTDKVWVVDGPECKLCQVASRGWRDHPRRFAPALFLDQGVIFSVPVDYQPPGAAGGGQPEP